VNVLPDQATFADVDARDAARAIILFDGVCNLCTHSVQFVSQRDPHAYFRFASLQSPSGQALAQRHGLSSTEIISVVLLEGGRAYLRSDAALRIAWHLTGAWPLLAIFRLVPRHVSDHLYNWIAANRYHWFGRSDECLIPSAALRERFFV
jgi:predicted DCC family thiol-disulfide oxidoreductase YuxK